MILRSIAPGFREGRENIRHRRLRWLKRRRSRYLCVVGRVRRPLGPPGSPPPPPPPAGSDIALGLAAVHRECASCHASQDWFNLTFFSYSDTTIIRRAVKHVVTTTADRIVAYIRSLNIPHVPSASALLQPGGRTVADDVQFAVNLFGQGTWPTQTTAQLVAINPITTPVAMALSKWSDEGSNLDCLPDSAPPPGFGSTRRTW